MTEDNASEEIKDDAPQEIDDCPVCEGPAIVARNGDWRCQNCFAHGSTVDGRLCVLRGGVK